MSRVRTPSRHRSARLLTLLPLAALGAGLVTSHARARRGRFLPPALSGRRETIETRAGRISFYATTEAEGTPLLLVHSINAAANAYEIKPLYEHYRRTRPVYALDLPGFGFSERSARIYTPETMRDAIDALAALIQARHGGPIDAIGLSLSCPYLARCALDRPDAFASLGLISPAGFDARLSGDGPPGTHRGKRTVHDLVAFPLWGRPLFDALVSRPSMRFFLQKTWGRREIDEGLLEYDQLSARQPGAEHAPLSFISGHLFPDDASRTYSALRLPVWAVHGNRGDFVDYRYIGEVAGKPNWHVDTLATGAFPHFEDRARVVALYDDFLRDRAAGAS